MISTSQFILFSMKLHAYTKLHNYIQSILVSFGRANFKLNILKLNIKKQKIDILY